jgi:hypothetical protein
MTLQLRLFVAFLALLSLLAARHLYRRQRAVEATHARLSAPHGALPAASQLPKGQAGHRAL